MTNTLALYGPGYLPVCRNVPDISRESKSSDAYLMTVTEQHPDLLDWLFANQHVGLTLWGVSYWVYKLVDRDESTIYRPRDEFVAWSSRSTVRLERPDIIRTAELVFLPDIIGGA